MRKNVFGRHFKRDTNERKALFKGLISSLVLHERIKTTEEKAKSIRSEVDKIITKAKKGEENARHLLQRQLPKEAIEKVVSEIAPRFDKRQGGYTRIVKIGRRFSDNASMVLMEWTEQNEVKSQSFDKLRIDPERSRMGQKSKVESLDKAEGKDKEEEGVHDKKEKTLMKKEVRQLKSKTSKTKKE